MHQKYAKLSVYCGRIRFTVFCPHRAQQAFAVGLGVMDVWTRVAFAEVFVVGGGWLYVAVAVTDYTNSFPVSAA